MAIYPTTIENGAGDRITFVRRVLGPGDRLEVENVLRPGGGPPMHVHHRQTEALTVHRGRLAWERPGEPPAFAGPGETVVFEAGEPHRYWNAGDEELRCTSTIQPAGNAEYVLAALYDSQKRSGGRRPNPFDAAFLARRFRNEFELMTVPALVRRFVFPLLLAIGQLLGKFDRYAGAPRPAMR
ncbi:MAG TPA: cupin domain-containing protein [Longimicrobium sp.]|jgi:mannose-6-phosphate isomerase-like protein (cupin superfamily)|nr:cupin domain-containing protein [Longimicrobium sp.]